VQGELVGDFIFAVAMWIYKSLALPDLLALVHCWQPPLFGFEPHIMLLLPVFISLMKLNVERFSHVLWTDVTMSVL